MPEGSPFSREQYFSAPTDAIRSALLSTGVARLSAAKYKMSNASATRIELSRRYLPRGAQVGCIVVIVLVLWVRTAEQESGTLIAGWVAALTMMFYRRRETLAMEVSEVDGGTRLLTLGNASKKARPIISSIYDDLGKQYVQPR